MIDPRRIAFALLLAAPLALAGACARPDAAHPVEDTRDAMGTYVRIRVVSNEAGAARAAIDAAYDEIARLEAILSEWREDSEISAINRAAGGDPVRVGPETLAVLERAIEIAEVTDGAFDPTFAACGRLWSFRKRIVPDDDALRECLTAVDWRRVRIDPEAGTVALPDAAMRIGIAGIGKGWILDRAADVLRGRGLADFSVDGGGDLVLSGRGPHGRWRVGIADPRRPGELHGSIEAGPGSVVTSGDYLQGFDLDGRRYHHILDPATGRPADRSVAVTVIAGDAATADALATGLFVLGPEAGLATVARLPGVEALFFGPDLAVRTSPGFPPVAR